MISKCEYADIRHLASIASQSHVSVSKTQDTQWFKAEKDGRIVGCSALMKKKKPIGRVKGIFVLEEFRGMGIGLELTNVLIQDAIEKHCSAIDLFTWHPDFWLKLGYRVIGKNSHGAERMCKGI